MAIVAGKTERTKLKKIVDEQYPLVKIFADPKLPDRKYILGSQLLAWSIGTAKTDVEYKLSGADILKAKQDGTHLSDLGVNPDEVIGESTGESLCGPIFAEREKPGQILPSTRAAFDKAVNNLMDISELYLATRACELNGKYTYLKCANKKYVGKTDFDTEPTNPWDRSWSSATLEGIAKTSWCITNGYSNYKSSIDKCTNF